MKKTQKKKTDKKEKLFKKYSKNKEFLTKSEIIKLMKNEFFLSYSKNVNTALMNIWGTKKKNKYVITMKNFKNLFTAKEGFFRNIKI